MRRSDKHIHELDRIDKEAAEWFVKIDLGLSRDESIAYKSWLEKDSRHKSRMEWYERTWNRFTPIEEFDDAEEEAFWPESSEPVGVRSRYARYLWVFGSFAAVLLVGFLVWRWGGKSEEFVEYESRFAVSAYEN
ncbi:MAG: hypothetical protein KJT03_21775, partial [Verrucomicrobiae bacterium]|nr:hypothetical protein [Verrucomicrobiae bacterium]